MKWLPDLPYAYLCFRGTVSPYLEIWVIHAVPIGQPSSDHAGSPLMHSIAMPMNVNAIYWNEDAQLYA